MNTGKSVPVYMRRPGGESLEQAGAHGIIQEMEQAWIGLLHQEINIVQYLLGWRGGIGILFCLFRTE
jgi:hypothetical protein